MELKTLLAALILLVAIASNGVDSGHSHHRPRCPPRSLPNDLETNTASAMNEMRKVIREYWRSENVGVISVYAQDLVRSVLDLLDTDSYKTVVTYFSFTIRYASRINLVEDNPGFCRRAEMINASVDYAETHDGLALGHVIGIHHKFRYASCIQIATDALSATGCKKLPAANATNAGDCFRKGRVYDLDKALKYYAGYLPHPICERIEPLYNSRNYIDNLVASAMVRSIVSAGRDGVLSDIRQLLEILWATIDLEKNKCCCKKYRERFESVCEIFAHANVNISGLSTTECPPGAAYEK